MEYTKSELLEKCREAIVDVGTFYQQDFINYRGKTADTDEYDTEVIAQFVCENINIFQTKIPVITRKATYNKTATHTGNFTEGSNRVEEIIAMKLVRQCENEFEFAYIGKIIDYQVPLKSTRKDVAGKIDLLSYNHNEKTAYILELKKPDSTETMLRCVLEGYTYLKTANRAKLLSDFGLPEDTKVKASPFVFKNGMQYQEMQEQRKWLCRLMELLDSKAYYLVEKNGIYLVEE